MGSASGRRASAGCGSTRARDATGLVAAADVCAALAREVLTDKVFHALAPGPLFLRSLLNRRRS